MVDLATKNCLKIVVYIVLKNWAKVTKFIIAIACLNFLTEIFELLFLIYILAIIITKKLQKSDRFNVIYIVDFLLLIINMLINKLSSANLAKEWEEWKATICTWYFNIRIAKFKYFL